MSAPARRPHADADRRTILIAPAFKRHMKALDVEDQRKCLQTIRWFEQEAAKGHPEKSKIIQECNKRRLRYVEASNLRVIYANKDGVRTWLWAGKKEDVYDEGRKIDGQIADKSQALDVESMLTWLRGQGKNEKAVAEHATSPDAKPPSVQPPKIEVDKLGEAVAGASMFVSDSKAVCESIKNKLAARRAQDAQTKSAVEWAAAVASAKADAETARAEAAEARLRGSGKAPTPIGLEELNALRAERDRLLEQVKFEKEKARVAEFNAGQKAMKSVEAELGKLKKENESLRTELTTTKSRLHDSLNKPLTSALTHDAVETLKEACAKINDDHASLLERTGTPRLEEQAEDIRRLSAKIRAYRPK